jgi:hypothetical protein
VSKGFDARMLERLGSDLATQVEPLRQRIGGSTAGDAATPPVVRRAPCAVRRAPCAVRRAPCAE